MKSRICKRNSTKLHDKSIDCTARKKIPALCEIILFQRKMKLKKNKTHTKKNRDMRIIICWMMRALFICGGFHHLKVKGRKAETKDAPVLALAPHSSFFDALPVVYLGGPSIVAKAEIGRIPFFGSRSPTFLHCQLVKVVVPFSGISPLLIIHVRNKYTR